MSASVVLTRNSSFDALQTFTMPSATISFTCRAAAAASAAGAMRAPPAPASPFATQTSQFASNPAQAMQPNTSGEPAFRVGSELPTAQGTAVKHECGPHSPFHKATKALPTSAIHLATDWEAQDLADQLEDLLVFTRTTHPGPDPQLLVHSPPADALRPAPPASKMHDTGSFAKQQHGVRIQVPGVRSAVAEADSVTPRAVSAEGNGDAGPAPQAQQAVQLSPVAQLAMMEGPSLEEMLRGPRPLREIALEVSRTSCMHPTFSQDLAVPPVLEADAAAAAALQRGVPASATLTEPAAAEMAQAGAAVLQCAPLHPIQQSCDQSSCCKPLSRSCATMPLSPTKSNGAMIQLAQLHKGEWHSSPSQDSEVSDWEEDSSCCTNASEDEASDNSMESAFRSRSARSCPSTQRRMGPQPQSLTLVERRTEQQAKTFSEQNLMDGIMTPEGVQRLMQHTSQQAPPPSPVLHTAVAGLQEGEGQGEEGENMMVVTLHPASTIPVPRSFPEYTSLTGRMLAEDHMPCAVMDSQEDPLPSTFAPTSCDTFPFVNPPPGVDSQAWSFDDEGFFRAGDDDLSGDTCLPSSLPALPLISSLPSSPAFSAFLRLLRTSSSEFEASGRVLRLRRYLRADVAPAVLDAVLDALAVNTRVEALYIQNFERGMGDSQLDRLGRVLARGKIWALNVGENFRISRQAWERFCARLPHTAVAHLFVSEAHLEGSDLKGRMRQAIRQNRRSAPPRDPQVVVHVGNMWWNPRLPGAAEQGRTECTGGSAAGTQGVGSKRLSSELEGEYEALCCSPSTRRSGSQRVGFRGSLVAGASRATLLRPLPPRVQLPDLGSATAGAAGTAGAAEPARGNTMVTRARAGVFVGAPVKDLESVEAGVDDDDEDFHVDDETPLSDDDYEDDTHLRHRCLPLRSARRFVPMAVTPARVSRRLIEKSSCGGAHPARAAGTAPASPYHSPAHPPKRLRGGISRESSASLGSEAGSAEDPVRQAAAHTGGAGVAGSKAAPMETEATSPLETQRAAHAAVAAEGRGSAPANLTAAPSKTVATGGYARKVGAVVGGRGRAAVAKRISGGTARAQRAELKGKSSFWELVDGGFMQPGQYQFTVGTQEVAVTVEEDGGIRYGSSRFRAISKFALVVLRERNPSRQSCDGWKEVAWNGEKLDVLRLRFQQYQRQQARKGGASAACS